MDMDPMRESSRAVSSARPHRPALLRHPTPTLHSLQSSFVRNISQLEQSAEDMSQGGSDIGEEIRRMNEEQKERSRQSSIQSSHAGEISVVKGGGGNGGAMDRMESTSSRASSHAHSIVDVNGAARWGGYSPGGFVTSPVESLRSHASYPRKASASGSLRLAHMVEPMQEGRPLDLPLAPSNAFYTPSRQASHASHTSNASHNSRSSVARRYDRIANELQESLEHNQQSPAKHAATMPIPGTEHRTGTATPPERPRSADTFQEAQLAFVDFDGVHFSPDTDEFVERDLHGNEIRRVSARGSSGGYSVEAASMLRTPRARPMLHAAPLPGKNMVYYPAPVPRMLNLPKRISQLPSVTVQARRRTQVLGQMSPEAKGSAPWLSQTNLSEAGKSQASGSESHNGDETSRRSMLNERMSVANFNQLPPQLRASVFFDHQTLQQDVEVKSGSAVATLDNILAASATAPVSAFTNHPFAGDVQKSVYAPDMSSRRHTTTFLPDEADKKKRRSSIANLLRRNSGGRELEDALEPNGSRSSLLMDFSEGGKKLGKRKSQMSLADELGRQSQAVGTPADELAEPDLHSGLILQAHNPSQQEEEEEEGEHRRVASGTQSATAHGAPMLKDGQQIEDDFKNAEAQEDVDEGEPMFVQPSTLLAELQVRKAQQKSRNRTAATAFPNGMHSTLLQMDAVEEISKRKRKNHKIALAWEDPQMHENENEDDDVPLGMLFPAKDGLINRKTGDMRDWDRPLGLMAKRELEDNETLSSRRNRLQGLPPTFGRKTFAPPNGSNIYLAGQPDAPPEEEEEDGLADETLVQRARRMKTKSVLDTAISDVAPKTGERPDSTFMDDVLSQFGGLDVKEKDAMAGASKKTPEPEEETLGQRKARLQREREASGDTGKTAGNTARPRLKSSNSLASLLAENPAGMRNVATNREYKPVEGTLLHTSAQVQSRQRQQLFNTNMRSSSFGLERTPLDARQPSSREANVGLYNNGIGGARAQQQAAQQQTLQTSAGTPLFGVNGANGYFASPTMGMQFNGRGGAMMGFPQQQQMGMGVNPLAYQALNGGRMGAMMGVGVMGGYEGTGGFPALQGYAMAQQKPITYGAAAMSMGGVSAMGQDEAGLGPRQREKIDRWRMSVAP